MTGTRDIVSSAPVTPLASTVSNALMASMEIRWREIAHLASVIHLGPKLSTTVINRTVNVFVVDDIEVKTVISALNILVTWRVVASRVTATFSVPNLVSAVPCLDSARASRVCLDSSVTHAARDISISRTLVASGAIVTWMDRGIPLVIRTLGSVIVSPTLADVVVILVRMGSGI